MTMREKVARRVIWSPLPGSQTAALLCPYNHILYEGTRGPGKSECQLMHFRKNVGKGYGAYWRGVIFGTEYKTFDDLKAKALKIFPQFKDGAKYLSSTVENRWVWPTGEQLLFRAINKEADYADYHGHEYPWMGWNELTSYPTPKLYDLMQSCNRSSFLPKENSPRDKNGNILKLLPEIPLVVFSTCNPSGVGHNWVKRKFVDVADPGEVVYIKSNVFNPRSGKREDVTRTQIRIFGSYKENRYLSPEYIASLESISEENKRRAWLWGDWDITSGGALDDLWTGNVHVIPRFPIPGSWYSNRSFDWGSTQPFSVGWWAEANGEEVTLPSGATWCPAAGSLIRFNEWYGGIEDNATMIGIKMSAPDIAKGINEREKNMVDDGWIVETPCAGPADNSIRDVREKDNDSIETKMEVEGVTWTESNKKPGSRIIGLQLIRDRLEASLRKSKGVSEPGPGIYFMDNCKHAISTLPVLPRDDKKPDDVDTNAEDHIYDDTRYRVLDGSNRYVTSVKVKFFN